VGPAGKPLAVIPLIASAASPLKAAAGGMVRWAEGALALAVVVGGLGLRRSGRRRYRLRRVRRG